MRQLAAIMFADMTGYTAMMHENEQLAKDKRRKLKETLEAGVAEFDGKIIQYYGDGALSIFNSAIHCVQCAVKMQQTLRMEPVVNVRIGLHVGDISFEDDDIFGDGVNLASRVETLATPGSVFISEKVYDEIKNHENFRVKEMGFFELKNIKNPVRVYAIDNAGLVVPSREELVGKTTVPVNRLAVLPFVNMSADPENEYFSDGITEELLNALTKVNGLQVTSRTSAFAFKGKNDDIRDIATKLNVDKILEGSVRKAGNRVRITAQLINAGDGYHIWSETYDRKLDDIFEVQDEISGMIANKLRENLSLQEHDSSLVKVPTSNIEAYTLYLKGVHHNNKMTPADGKKAIEYFEQALALEPGYAEAYAQIADTYAYLGGTGQVQTDKAFDIVHRYSDKALQLDPNLASGWVAKGSAYMFYDWKWEDGYRCFQKAMELNPSSTAPHQLLCFYYGIVGQPEEGVKIAEIAYARDPLSPVVNHNLAESYMAVGRYDDAIRIVEHMLEMHPNMRASMELKGWATGLKGNWHAAIEIFKEVHRLTGHPLKGITTLAYGYGKTGEKEKALEYIDKMKQRELEDPDAVMDSDFAVAYWGLGEKEKAIEYLNKGIDKRLGAVALMLDAKIFSGLEKMPEYEELRKRMNL